MPKLSRSMEKTELKKGEYFPIKTPKTKIMEEMIISTFPIKKGLKEKSKPIRM